jgi:type I restriction enzyme S subunit
MGDSPQLLPQGWTRTTVGEIFDIRGGGTPPTENPAFWDGSIPWMTSADIHGLNDIKPRKKITLDAVEKSATHCVPKGSIIVVTRVGLGKIALAPTDLCFSQDCQALIGNWNNLVSEYCLYYLSVAVQIFKYKNQGTTISGVTVKQLRELEFPLPPLPEQHRIVTKIEELLSQLDAGITSLKKVQVQLKRYRQAVLKAAFEGRLTQEWREEHKEEIEPADILIENVRKKPELNKYSIIDQTSVPQLPEGWVWAKLGQLSDMSAGKAFLKSEYSENGVKLLQIANVSFGKITWDVVTFLPQDYLKKYSELTLKNGDMLIALNRPVLDGKLKIGVLKERDCPSILYQRVGRFDLYNHEFRDFIFFFAQSPSFINYLNKSLQGIEIPFINKPVLLNALVAFPPLKEQQVIVSEVERIFSICDAMEATITTSLRQAETLRHSILNRAFEGKLVPQDPNDEPASILLEKIKAEKARHTAEAKKGKTL